MWQEASRLWLKSDLRGDVRWLVVFQASWPAAFGEREKTRSPVYKTMKKRTLQGALFLDLDTVPGWRSPRGRLSDAYQRDSKTCVMPGNSLQR